jgi:hypothetical protein
MFNRKLQIALFAAIAAVGLATAPVTAAAGPSPVQQGATNDDADKPKQGKSSNSKYGNKQDKDDDSDKWEKLRRQMQYKMMQYKKQYEKKQYETTASAKPAQAAYQRPAQAPNAKIAAAKPATPAPAAAGPCNCLTKEYTGDGKVVFKDICTKEVAVVTKEAALNSKDGEKN